MPPKKGKSKKSGKKGKKSGKKPEKKSAQLHEEIITLSNENKENFLIQIQDLEKQIHFYQRKCDDFVIMNGMYEAEFVQTNEDKVDISEHLDILLKIRVEEIMKLNLELNKLQELRDQEKAVFEQQIIQKKAEFEDITEQLNSDKRIKSGQLASMEEFRIQKEELMQKFTDLHEEIRLLDEINSEDVYQRERIEVVEMDRLKKEMISRVNNVSSEFRKVSNRQMAETNKKTIRENVELSNLIKNKSEKTMELIEENDRLRIIGSENKRQIEISEAVEKELLKKNEINIKKIQYCIEECRNSEMEISKFESEEFQSNVEKIQAENGDFISKKLSQQEKYVIVHENYDAMMKEKEMIGSEITLLKRKLKVHKRLISRTKNALIDTENLIDPTEEFTEGEVILRRKMMMNSLLELLNTATVLGFGLEPHQLGKQRKFSKLSV